MKLFFFLLSFLPNLALAEDPPGLTLAYETKLELTHYSATPIGGPKCAAEGGNGGKNESPSGIRPLDATIQGGGTTFKGQKNVVLAAMPQKGGSASIFGCFFTLPVAYPGKLFYGGDHYGEDSNGKMKADISSICDDTVKKTIRDTPARVFNCKGKRAGKVADQKPDAQDNPDDAVDKGKKLAENEDPPPKDSGGGGLPAIPPIPPSGENSKPSSRISSRDDLPSPRAPSSNPKPIVDSTALTAPPSAPLAPAQTAKFTPAPVPNFAPGEKGINLNQANISSDAGSPAAAKISDPGTPLSKALRATFGNSSGSGARQAQAEGSSSREDLPNRNGNTGDPASESFSAIGGGGSYSSGGKSAGTSTPFDQSPLDDPKITLAGSEVASLVTKMTDEYGSKEENGSEDNSTIFERVHGAHNRCLHRICVVRPR